LAAILNVSRNGYHDKNYPLRPSSTLRLRKVDCGASTAVRGPLWVDRGRRRITDPGACNPWSANLQIDTRV